MTTLITAAKETILKTTIVDLMQTEHNRISWGLVIIKNPLPYSLEYAKDQRNRWGVSRKQFLSIFKGATYLTYPAREFIYAPAIPTGS